MKKNWTLQDIIDLEFFTHQDDAVFTEEEVAAIRQRDRQIFLEEFPDADRNNILPARRQLIATWLKCRRLEAEKDNVTLPGVIFQDAERSVRGISGIAGLLLGISTAVSMLHYTGEEPINVFFYLAFIVLTQILLIIILPLAMLIRTKNRSFFSFGLLHTLTMRFLLKLYKKSQERISRHLSAEKRNSLESILGLISNKRQTYGSLFFWPVFLTFQLFGICFNIAALLTTLFLITISDIAFGWQSTIQLSAGAVHGFVRILASPWTWIFGEGRWHPALGEIEGSRIILKDTIQSLATTDLASWWPFLVLCVITYGLLPRLFLFILAVWSQRFLLKRLRFDQNKFSSLIRRMTTPLFSSNDPHPQSSSQTTDNFTPPPRIEPGPAQTSATILIPEELSERYTDNELSAVLSDTIGLTMKEKFNIEYDYLKERQMITKLGQLLSEKNRCVFIVAEGWLPPIDDLFFLIKELRKISEKHCPIHIGLLGRPGKTTIFTPVSSSDLQIWQKKIHTLGDPYLNVQPIIGITE